MTTQPAQNRNGESNEPHVNDDKAQRPEPAFKRVYVIVNPAAGQDRPILGLLNRAFQESNIDWDLFLTKKAGDGYRLAQEAVAAGVSAVAVYGGDGTVMEVANALVGTGVPLAIFPGGTANVMSIELGIPGDLAQAAALVCSDEHMVRAVDVGRVSGRYFLLRVGIGLEAQMMNNANRETKERLGRFAYVMSAIQSLQERQVAHYRLTLDDQTVEADGMTCMIANSGNMGVSGLQMSKTIDVTDGLLDVVVVRDADLGSLLNVAASAVGIAEPPQHWQARRVHVETDPPQPVICDGEPLDPGPITAEVVAGGLKVIVPLAAAAADVPAVPDTAGTTPAVGSAPA